jgi:hypothetical protein
MRREIGTLTQVHGNEAGKHTSQEPDMLYAPLALLLANTMRPEPVADVRVRRGSR